MKVPKMKLGENASRRPFLTRGDVWMPVTISDHRRRGPKGGELEWLVALIRIRPVSMKRIVPHAPRRRQHTDGAR